MFCVYMVISLSDCFNFFLLFFSVAHKKYLSFIIAITNKLPHICGHFMGD